MVESTVEEILACCTKRLVAVNTELEPKTQATPVCCKKLQAVVSTALARTTQEIPVYCKNPRVVESIALAPMIPAILGCYRNQLVIESTELALMTPEKQACCKKPPVAVNIEPAKMTREMLPSCKTQQVASTELEMMIVEMHRCCRMRHHLSRKRPCTVSQSKKEREDCRCSLDNSLVADKVACDTLLRRHHDAFRRLRSRLHVPCGDVPCGVPCGLCDELCALCDGAFHRGHRRILLHHGRLRSRPRNHLHVLRHCRLRIRRRLHRHTNGMRQPQRKSMPQLKNTLGDKNKLARTKQARPKSHQNMRVAKRQVLQKSLRGSYHLRICLRVCCKILDIEGLRTKQVLR